MNSSSVSSSVSIEMKTSDGTMQSNSNSYESKNTVSMSCNIKTQKKKRHPLFQKWKKSKASRTQVVQNAKKMCEITQAQFQQDLKVERLRKIEECKKIGIPINQELKSQLDYKPHIKICKIPEQIYFAKSKTSKFVMWSNYTYYYK